MFGLMCRQILRSQEEKQGDERVVALQLLNAASTQLFYFVNPDAQITS